MPVNGVARSFINNYIDFLPVSKLRVATIFIEMLAVLEHVMCACAWLLAGIYLPPNGGDMTKKELLIGENYVKFCLNVISIPLCFIKFVF